MDEAGILTSWPEVNAFLQVYSDWAALIVTMFAIVLLVITSLYKPHTRKPDLHSKRIVAPLVVTFCIIVTLYSIWIGRPISAHVVNGIAIFALFGAIFRLLPFSEQDAGSW